MARKVRHSSLENRTGRLKLAVRPKPYNGPKLARGIHLLYRRICSAPSNRMTRR